MASPLKFKIPHDAGIFHRFLELPVELQQMIWHATVNDPGIHFYKVNGLALLNAANVWWPNTLHAPMYNAAEDAAEDFFLQHLKVGLGCEENNPEADISQHVVVCEQLYRLLGVDKMTLEFVCFLAGHPDTVSLTPYGGPTMLAGTCDAVCLSYLPNELYMTNCGLPVSFDSTELADIRRVALRYSHQWTLGRRRGRRAGSIESQRFVMRPPVLPRHVYQFLARSFPDLDEVWFIDYMMLPKKAEDSEVRKESLNKGTYSPPGVKKKRIRKTHND